jgi:protein-S-isoprenylcysteine O-methyltransferase Ste14
VNPWYAKGTVIAACALLVAIRAPHGHRSRAVPVAESRRGPLEVALLTFAWLSFFAPLLWVASDLFAFAEFELPPLPFALGLACYAAGLALFWRSHADLGTNWSITLELRAQHTLVTDGVYRRLRHPMYTSLLLFGLGQWLAVPNWFVAPTYFAAMALIVACRLGPEERMLRGRFGAAWDEYARRSARLVPGLW